MGTATVKAEVTSGGEETFEDVYTAYSTVEGSDGIQVLLSNEAHAFQANSNGNVDDSEASAGKSTIKVLHGSRLLTYVAPSGSDPNVVPDNTTTKSGTYTVITQDEDTLTNIQIEKNELERLELFLK